MLEQRVVHLPELPLCTGGFGGFGCVLGVRMYLRERKVAEYKPQLPAQALLNGLDDDKGLSAVGTFIVPVLDERHGSAVRSLYVVAFTDRQHELAHRSAPW